MLFTLSVGSSISVASDFFGESDIPEHTIRYDEDEILEIMPILIPDNGNFDDMRPDMIYARIYEYEDCNYSILQMFNYYALQDSWMAYHYHDYEYNSVWYNETSEGEYNILKTIYNDWHYVIGREYEPKMYETNDDYADERFAFSVNPNHHNFDSYSGGISDYLIDMGVEHIDYDILSEMDDEFLEGASENIGFDTYIANNPNVVWEEGGVFSEYDRFDMWNSKWDSLITAFKWVFVDY